VGGIGKTMDALMLIYSNINTSSTHLISNTKGLEFLPFVCTYMRVPAKATSGLSCRAVLLIMFEFVLVCATCSVGRGAA